MTGDWYASNGTEDDRIKITVAEDERAYTDSELRPGNRGARINQETVELCAKLAEAKSVVITDLVIAKQVGFSDQFASNWDLSSARASSVANHMINNQGLAETRFSVTGFADTEPVDTNEATEGRQRNRRVEIIIDN